ncbi:hypothetical protein SAMN03159453_04471 [Pseudomonas sp. NFIX28]|nr:hypothetical protein SAMN03159453_04471 [Pseudomonas sp. NFIX28]
MELRCRDKPLKCSRLRIARRFGKAPSRDFPAMVPPAASRVPPSSRASSPASLAPTPAIARHYPYRRSEACPRRRPQEPRRLQGPLRQQAWLPTPAITRHHPFRRSEACPRRRPQESRHLQGPLRQQAWLLRPPSPAITHSVGARLAREGGLKNPVVFKGLFASKLGSYASCGWMIASGAAKPRPRHLHR